MIFHIIVYYEKYSQWTHFVSKLKDEIDNVNLINKQFSIGNITFIGCSASEPEHSYAIEAIGVMFLKDGLLVQRAIDLFNIDKRIRQ